VEGGTYFSKFEGFLNPVCKRKVEIVSIVRNGGRNLKWGIRDDSSSSADTSGFAGSWWMGCIPWEWMKFLPTGCTRVR